MSTWLGIALVIAANVVAVAVMLTVRRRAPAGGYYRDMQQAGWVYSAAGTSFAVILAFVFVLAFQSFDRARTSASAEAEATTSLFATAAIFPAAERDALQGELVCYARAVIALEWPAMRDGTSSDVVQDWVFQLHRTFAEAPASTNPKVDAAYGSWLATMQERQDGRQGRLDEARPFVPPLVWVFLLVGSVLVIAFVWLFVDSAERTFAQAALPIGITTVIVSGLVLVRFFDAPYLTTPGSVQPEAMERTLHLMEGFRDLAIRAPCDTSGRPA
ncbi:MAG: hypothetical protein IRZ32_18165 [Solirubrobacteraceae bacterium]|nr:hypothetical protein [Solirubrobacteraceae bacterium]